MDLGTIVFGGYNGSGQSYYATLKATAVGVSAGAPTDSALKIGTNNGTLREVLWIDGAGAIVPKVSYTASQLGSLAGTFGATVWCSDCTAAATCTTGGGGHWAVRNHAETTWTCQ
jgi:hypothetical protein